MICLKCPTYLQGCKIKNIPFFIIYALHIKNSYIKITKHKKLEASRTIQISSDFASLHNSHENSTAQSGPYLVFLNHSSIIYIDRIFYIREKTTYRGNKIALSFIQHTYCTYC